MTRGNPTVLAQGLPDSMSPWERAASAASKKASARPVAKETEKSKKAEERKTIKKRAPIVKFKNGDYIHDPESEEYKYSYVKAMPMEPGTFLICWHSNVEGVWRKCSTYNGFYGEGVVSATTKQLQRYTLCAMPTNFPIF